MQTLLPQGKSQPLTDRGQEGRLFSVYHLTAHCMGPSSFLWSSWCQSLSEGETVLLARSLTCFSLTIPTSHLHQRSASFKHQNCSTFVSRTLKALLFIWKSVLRGLCWSGCALFPLLVIFRYPRVFDYFLFLELSFWFWWHEKAQYTGGQHGVFIPWAMPALM